MQTAAIRQVIGDLGNLAIEHPHGAGDGLQVAEQVRAGDEIDDRVQTKL